MSPFRDITYKVTVFFCVQMSYTKKHKVDSLYDDDDDEKSGF